MSTGPVIPCLALLRVGVTEPPGSPRTLVRSYRTVSPLPDLRQRTSTAIGGLLSVALNRQVTPSWLSPAPCPVESRLSSTPIRGRGPVPRPPSRLTVVEQCTKPPGQRSAAKKIPGGGCDRNYIGVICFPHVRSDARSTAPFVR